MIRYIKVDSITTHVLIFALLYNKIIIHVKLTYVGFAHFPLYKRGYFRPRVQLQLYKNFLNRGYIHHSCCTHVWYFELKSILSTCTGYLSILFIFGLVPAPPLVSHGTYSTCRCSYIHVNENRRSIYKLIINIVPVDFRTCPSPGSVQHILTFFINVLTPNTHYNLWKCQHLHKKVHNHVAL